MSENRRLFKAGSLYFFGNIFDKAVAFITVPIFTRMLTTSEYGLTTTYLSWINILSVIITLSLGNSIRSAVLDFSDNKDEYLSSIFALGTLSAMIITLGLCIISLLGGKKYNLQVVLLCCIDSYATSILTTIKWRYMMDMKYIQRTMLQSIPNVLIVVIAVLMISYMDSPKYMGRIWANTLVTFIIAIVYLLYYFFHGKTAYNKTYWQYALNFSLPLIFHSLSNVVLSQADRTMITLLRDSSETGLYGLAYQFGMIPLVITTTFENIWIPWFTEKMETEDKSTINQMVKPYINMVVIICIGVMLVAPEMLEFMSNAEYHSAIYMIAPVVCANFLMFLSSVSINLEYYLKQTKNIARNTLIAAIINIVLNYIFIPKYGAIVAAYTTVVSYGVSFLMHYFFARKIDRELFKINVYIVPLILITSFTLLTNLLIKFIFLRWGIGVIMGGIFLVSIRRFKIQGFI